MLCMALYHTNIFTPAEAINSGDTSLFVCSLELACPETSGMYEENRVRTRGWETSLKSSQAQVLKKAGRPFHLIP